MQSAENSMNRSSRVLEVLLVMAVCLCALVLRLWHLGDMPVVLFHDEADNSIVAIKSLVTGHPTIFEFDWKPQPALGTGLEALSFYLGGISVWALRLPAVLMSVLGLVLFYLAARLATQSIPASLTAMILLSTHAGYLHFSRTAWENIGVCSGVIADFLLISILLKRQIQKSGNTNGAESTVVDIALTALIGLCTAFSVMIYFAGRVSVVLIPVYFLLCILHPATKGVRWSCFGYLCLIFLFTGLFLSPFLLNYQTLVLDVRTTSLMRREFPVLQLWNEGKIRELVTYIFLRTGEAFCWIWWPMDHDARYFPGGFSLLSWYAVILVLIGWWVSLMTKSKNTGWWWLVLIVPYIVSQVFISSVFNLARGSLVLPALYLFLALGLGHVVGFCRKRRDQILVCGLLALSGAIEGSLRYFAWMESDEFRRVIEPAIEPEDIAPWLQQVYVQTRGNPGDSCIFPYRKPNDPLRKACEEQQGQYHE